MEVKFYCISYCSACNVALIKLRIKMFLKIMTYLFSALPLSTRWLLIQYHITSKLVLIVRNSNFPLNSLKIAFKKNSVKISSSQEVSEILLTTSQNRVFQNKPYLQPQTKTDFISQPCLSSKMLFRTNGHEESLQKTHWHFCCSIYIRFPLNYFVYAKTNLNI